MIDQQKLMSFMGKFVGDLGAVVHAPLVLVGARLGLYQGLAEGGRQTPAALARRTGTDARYVSEWLAANAASGYAHYHSADGSYELDAEQAFTLADPKSAAYLPGAYKIALSMFRDLDKLEDAYRTGRGVAWGEHDRSLFDGTEEFFRPSYQRDLVANWIPALDGVSARLEAGGRIADVGCGHGSSVILLAQAFPGTGYDLVAFFDCLHDMGDPVGAARHVHGALADGGVLMVVEPQAADRVEENLNPVGRVYYSASSFICTPASRAQDVGLCLGAQAGEAKLREVLLAGGFRKVRRAAETPFNMILEARR
jgi:SAM-dependent methyltransferase